MPRTKEIKDFDNLVAGYLATYENAKPKEIKEYIEGTTGPGFGKNLVLKTYQRAVKRVKPLVEEMKSSFADKPWNRGALNEYKFLLPGVISNESLPAISKLMAYREQKNESLKIRDAIWASRLYLEITDIQVLSMYVTIYSLLEKISFLSQTPLDTSMLDFSIEAGLPNGVGLIVQIQSMPIPDDYKIALGKQWAGKFEKKLIDYTLSQNIELNGRSWLGYVLWLGILSKDDKFNSLSKSKREIIISHLIDWYVTYSVHNDEPSTDPLFFDDLKSFGINDMKKAGE